MVLQKYCATLKIPLPISYNLRTVIVTNLLQVNSLTDQVMKAGKLVGLNIRRAREGNPLPPASLQQFLKSPKTSIAGILLSNHDEGFSNRSHQVFHIISPSICFDFD